MFTVIAILIAIDKEHKGYAWFLGFILLCHIILFAKGEAESYTILSGLLWFIISLFLSDRKKERKQQEEEQRRMLREEMERHSRAEKINETYYSQTYSEARNEAGQSTGTYSSQSQGTYQRATRKFCSSCGQRLDGNKPFCPYCGCSQEN